LSAWGSLSTTIMRYTRLSKVFMSIFETESAKFINYDFTDYALQRSFPAIAVALRFNNDQWFKVFGISDWWDWKHCIGLGVAILCEQSWRISCPTPSRGISEVTLTLRVTTKNAYVFE
jgi:hypothetical protein